jgi:hypothetical protein
MHTTAKYTGSKETSDDEGNGGGTANNNVSLAFDPFG